jgi:hypothetical protein
LAPLAFRRPAGTALAIARDRGVPRRRRRAVVDIALDGDGRGDTRIDHPRDLDDALPSVHSRLDAVTDIHR